MNIERRWMKSILAAAHEPLVALPWARGTRRRPAAFAASAAPQTAATKPAPAPKAVAAR